MSELHPEIRRVLDLVENAGNAQYHEMSATDAREAHEERAPLLDMPSEPLPHVEDVLVPGPAGQLPMRTYAASANPDGLPVVLWLHGGGHTVGSIACYDSICRRLAAGSGALVASLEYRLAPEHKFPCALDDAFASLQWLTSHAERVGGDSERVAIAGDSAGGNLAAVCALLARDDGIDGLKHQLLVYPALAGDCASASHAEFAEGHLLTRADIEWFQAQYLSSDEQRADWRYAPLQAPDHSRLASATVIVASHDPLRDDGIAYARVLERAGTPANLIVAEGMVHAFWSLGGAVRAAPRSIDEAAGLLRSAFVTS